jgi:hypothetical protein
MENTNNISHFIKADDNTLINAKAIVWIKKMDDCLEVCSKINGCQLELNTHKICKFNTPDSYNRLNVLFE